MLTPPPPSLLPLLACTHLRAHGHSRILAFASTSAVFCISIVPIQIRRYASCGCCGISATCSWAALHLAADLPLRAVVTLSSHATYYWQVGSAESSWCPAGIDEEGGSEEFLVFENVLKGVAAEVGLEPVYKYDDDQLDACFLPVR